MLRFGLFGTGHWAAETHGAALHAHPEAELVGVWGRNPERAAMLAERYGVPAYADVDALIEACEAIAVALPPDIQADIAVRAASAGRHLLLDKPLALSRRRRRPGGRRRRGVRGRLGRLLHPAVPAERDRVPRRDRRRRWLAARPGHRVRLDLPAGQPVRRLAVAARAWRALGHRPARALAHPAGARPGRPGWPRWTVRAGRCTCCSPTTGGATSSASLTLDAPPEAVAREFVFYGENGIETVPPGEATRRPRSAWRSTS